jgi:hypothetical protein
MYIIYNRVKKTFFHTKFVKNLEEKTGISRYRFKKLWKNETLTEGEFSIYPSKDLDNL